MLTQAAYFAFDTKAKPGKIICHGIRYETLEIDGTMADVKVPLLCNVNMNQLAPAKREALIQALQQNF